MLKILIIGTGYIGLSHIAAYKQISDAQVVGIIDRNPESGTKAAIEAECKYYSSLTEALTKETADFVDVCLPTYLHEEYVIEAANAKCHVLCEKPVTFSLESFDRMVNACKNNGVRFMVGQIARWWPEFEVIKEYIQNDKLGKIHMIYEKRLAQHPNWATWHREPEKSGGGLYDINIHDIDFLYSIFGMPVRVYSTGWKSSTGCWNHVSTSLTWADGTNAVCETALEMTGNFPFTIEFRGSGDKGTLNYMLTAGFNIKDGEQGSSFKYYPAGEEKIESLEVKQTDMFVSEISAYVSAIIENEPTPIPPDQSREVLEIILASKRSLEELCVVDL